MKDSRPAIAVKRFDDDIAMAFAKGADLARIAGDQRWRGQFGKIQHQKLFRAVADPERIVDDESLGMNAIQKMRIGDIGHIKGGVLAQPDHVEFRQIDLGPIAKGDVISRLSAQRHRTSKCQHPPLGIAEPVGGVLEQPVPPRLGLKPKAECAVTIDRDLLDRVHLEGNVKTHRICSSLFQAEFSPAGTGFARPGISSGQRHSRQSRRDRTGQPAPRQSAWQSKGHPAGGRRIPAPRCRYARSGAPRSARPPMHAGPIS